MSTDPLKLRPVAGATTEVVRVAPRKRVTRAVRWWANGDHPDDGNHQTEGDLVKHYKHTEVRGSDECTDCGRFVQDHGWINEGRRDRSTGERGLNVCPGDWVLDSTVGHSVMDDKTFRENYLRVMKHPPPLGEIK